MPSAGTITAGKAYVIISAIDKTQHVLGQVTRKVQATARQMQAMGTKMVLGAGMAALGAALPVSQYAKFEDAMLATRAKMQASETDYQRLTKLAQHYGETTSYTAQQVAETMVVMAQMGLKANDVEKALGAILASARATGAELPAMADYVLTAIRSFGGDFSEAAQYADVMTAACNNSALSMEELGYALQYASASGQLAGSDIKEVTTLLAALANMGIRGTMAGSSLRRIYEKLATNRNKLLELGVNPFDADGNYRPIMEIITDLSAAIQNLPQGEKIQLLTRIFEVRGMTGAAKLTQESFTELAAAIQNCDGVAQQTAETMDSGMGGSFRLIWSAVERVGNAFGETFRNAIVSARERVIAFVQSITKWIETHRHLVIMAALGVGAIMAFGAALITTGLAIQFTTYALGGFQIFLAALSGSLRLVMGLLYSLPAVLGGVVAAGRMAIGLFATALHILPAMIGGLITLCTGAVTMTIGAITAVGGALGAITAVHLAALAAVAAAGAAAWAFWPELVELLSQAAGAIGTTLGRMGQAVAEYAGRAATVLSHAFGTAWQHVAQASGQLWSDLKTDCHAAFTAIAAQISAGDWSGAFETAVMALQAIWASFQEFFLRTWHGTAMAFNEIWLKCQQTFQTIVDKIADGLAAVYGLFLSEEDRRTFQSALNDEQATARRKLQMDFDATQRRHQEAIEAARARTIEKQTQLTQRAETVVEQAAANQSQEAEAPKELTPPEIAAPAVQAMPEMAARILAGSALTTQILEVAQRGSVAAEQHFKENQASLREALLEQAKADKKDKNLEEIAGAAKDIKEILEEREEPEAIY